MKDDFAPMLHPVKVAELRPTQMTLGFREVARKRAEWRRRAERDGPDFLGRHMIPVILGPRSTTYILDHHHLVRALLEEGISHVLVNVIADLKGLKKSAFWTVMDNRNWLHPFDNEGKRHSHEDLPKGVEAMKDDPYRSLAGELRRSGGYAKDPMPYAEFLWADFLRHRISAKHVEHDFERALDEALTAARRQDASYLPGWCGRSEEAGH